MGAALRLVAEANPEFRERTTILCVGNPQAELKLKNIRDLRIEAFPTVETLLVRLDAVLATGNMGLRLYCAGSEGFIARVVQHAELNGADHKSIATEHCGSLARRIQCIHCKGITENVMTTLTKCSHCGLLLAVRDHYSRRLGAFMAVAADAEAPGEVLASETFR